MLQDVLRNAYAAGHTSFDGPVIVAMREAYRAECEASGKTKNAGSVLFSRSWDALIADGLPLEPRKSAGKGRNAGKAKATASAGDAGDGSEDATASATVDKGAIARKMCEDAGLDGDLVKLLAKAFKGLEKTLKDKTHGSAAKDARFALRNAAGKLNKLLAAAGIEVTAEDVKAAADAAKPAATAKPVKAVKASKATKTESAGAAA
jgi:hypothetical protein